jgi:photosystem II stability/assembly factor-like uncharacterized protein
MHRPDDATAAVDKHGAGKNGWQEADPPVPPTRMRAEWFDDLTENVCRPIEALGFTLVKGDFGQLLAALDAQAAFQAACNVDVTVTGASDACNDIAFGLQAVSAIPLWVSVHNTGIIRTSPDLVTWTARTSGTSEHFQAIAFNGTDFVAVGNNGAIKRSTDGGVTWSGSAQGSDVHWDVCWSAALSLWIVVGNNGVIRTSPDGATWTTRTSGTANHLRSVAASGSRVIAIDASGNYYSSANAITWAAGAVVSANLGFTRRVRYLNGVWVVGGRRTGGAGPASATSPDGTTWTQGPAYTGYYSDGENEVYDIAALGGVFIGVTSIPGGPLVTSLDGRTWTPRHGTSIAAFRRVSSSGDRLAYVGDGTVTDRVGRSHRIVIR